MDNPTVNRFHDGNRFINVIASPCRKWTKVFYIDSPVRMKKVLTKEFNRYSSPLNAPLKKTARSFIKAGKSLGISKAVKKSLYKIIKH